MPQTAEDLTDLASMIAGPHAAEAVMERALFALRSVVPYDLAAVLTLEEDELRVRAAAGPLASPAVRAHRLPLRDRPTLRRVLELRRPLAVDAHHHDSDEGDPYDGVLDLPSGHSCMVVPLFAGGDTLGVITLDRTVCEPYPEHTVELAGVYGQLVSLALLFARQAMQLDRYRHQLEEHNRLLGERSGCGKTAVRRIELSRSGVMQQLAQLARQVAASDLPVLIQGETGTGKEVLAQAVHHWSPRVDGPFVTLNCSAIPEQLVESELFGHVKGAFTGADQARQGRFLTADGGTLLLDEIGDMPLMAQAKLLRVLQEGTIKPVGSDTNVRVNVRVVAATHVDLPTAVREGKFREDLYYRLAVFPLALPALRDRIEDVVPIAQALLDDEANRGQRGPWTLAPSAERALQSAPWPGNVRELQNCVERATILQPAGEIRVEHLGLLRDARAVTSPAPTDTAFPDYRQAERRYLAEALRRTEGRVYGADGAAALVGLKPTTLQSKLKKAELK